MQAFVAIVEGGSLTAAAAALGKSPPTMVRTLAELEAELGVTLLRRTTRRMSLTDEGRVYHERCLAILADIKETEELLTLGATKPRGKLRVTAPVRFGQLHVAPAVVAFLERHSEVEVELLLLDRVVNLVDEGIDVAVRIGAMPDSSLMARTAGSVRRVVCASPRLLRQGGTPKHPSELAQRSCVRFSGLSADSSWRFEHQGRGLSVRVRGNLSVNQAGAAIDACVAGAGFGQFLSYQVEPAVRAKRLRVVLRDYEPAPVPISLVYPEARLVSPRLRVFLDWMKARLLERRGLS